MKKLNELETSFGLAGASIGMGIAGEAFNSEGLKQGGKIAGNFIPIGINIGMGALTLKMLKDLKD